MNEEKLTYQTIQAPAEGVYREKGSKFLAYAYPILNAEGFKICLEKVKKQHHTARHFCYAWQIGVETIQFRANDDGEPGGTAGKPILGQIHSFGLTNVGIIVVRYFGGTKLGTGGLIRAYKEAAKNSLSNSRVEIKELRDFFLAEFEYPDISQISSILGQVKATIHQRDFKQKCIWKVSTSISHTSLIKSKLRELGRVKFSFLGRD